MDCRDFARISFRCGREIGQFADRLSFSGPTRCGVLVSRMAKHDPDLSLLFHALSDPTRRAMLGRLAVGPAAVTELAAPTGLRLPTVLRHLAVLEAAGLIATAKDGRVRTCAFVPAALTPARDWMEAQRALWEGRLDRLDDYVMKLMQENGRDG